MNEGRIYDMVHSVLPKPHPREKLNAKQAYAKARHEIDDIASKKAEEEKLKEVWDEILL